MSYITGKVPLRLKLINGFGTVAFGIKDVGFLYFLLPFYNLVLGVEAWIVSLALATALVIDGFVDPLIGHLSDRTYTRWGRRLPWLYIAPIPLALVWVLLWSPPLAGVPGFWEIVALTACVRILLSACEVPSISLVPEITDDYDERTTMFRFRFLAGWLGGLFMMVMAYSVFLPTPEAQLQPSGYAAYGAFGAVMMAIAVIGSAAGQHSLVARRPPTAPPQFSLGHAFGEIFDAFRERAFVIFALGALAAYIGQGLTFSMTTYVNLYVWQFNDIAFQILPMVLASSVIFMFLLVGPLHKRFGKPNSAAGGALVGMVFQFSPYLLLLAGLWPQPGSTASTALLLCLMVIGNTAGIVALISSTSMVAEIIEAFEERTGKRAEGTFYSGNWLVQKCASAGGLLLSGMIIQTLGIEQGTPQDAISPQIVTQLALAFMVVGVILGLIAAFWLMRFPITREQHEARVAAKRARESASDIPAPADPVDNAVRTDPDAPVASP